MNFLCHAIPYLDQPWVAVATGVPDWLRMADRSIRARARVVQPFLMSDDAELRAVARGLICHIEDDRWFHGTRAFAETNLQLAIELRELLPGDAGFRPTFVGHILIEMLLDASWIRRDPTWADRYYDAIGQLTPESIQQRVNRITGKPTDRLSGVIRRFCQARFLYDYLDPARLLWRLNQVMGRVRLPALPGSIQRWLPAAENVVESRRRELLTPPEAASPFPGLESPT